MTTLRITVAGRTWTFEEPRVVRVGRDAGADVVLDRPSISRHHLELRSEGRGWQVVDVGSSAGTWIGARRVQAFGLGAPTTVRLGDDSTGLEIALAADAPAVAPPTPPFTPPAPPAPPRPPAPASPYAPPAGGPARPVGGPVHLPPPGLDVTRVPTAAGAPGYGGPGLVVRTNVSTHRFAPGQLVRIGRDPGLELVADDSAVSRQHATLDLRPDGWWFSDRSTGGSYLAGGERITVRRISEPTTIVLGHPTAGFAIEVVPAVDAATAQRGIARKRRKKGLLVGAAAMAGVVVVGGGIGLAAALGGGGGGDAGDGGHGGSAALERAKRASVFIIAEDAGGTPEYTGSGSIISDTGLILTAAHVGEPEAPGQRTGESNPDTLLIALTSPEDDKPVEAAYEAKPVVSDGVLDMSVLQIVADADGNPIEPGDLAAKLPDPIPIGDSDELATGDDITALGFPALASLSADDQLSPSLTVTKGVVATFEPSKVLDTQRAWIDSDVRIGSGNSGGASINSDGELIGVNDAVITATTAQGHAGEFTGGSALIRPVNLAKEILDLARKGDGSSYTSPFLDDVPAPGQQTSGASVTPNEWATSQTHCAGSSGPSNPSVLTGLHAGSQVYAQFTVEGMANGTDVAIKVTDSTGATLASGSQPWKLGPSKVCIYLLVTFTSEPPTAAAAVVTAAGQNLATTAAVFR